MKTWFITGISSGLGKALAQRAMAEGDFVIGTFRQQAQAYGFSNEYPNKGLGVCMDVTKNTEIEAAFGIIKEKFGRIDVLVNNAGFGLAGAIEETSNQEARAIFEANFWGTLLITQMALPFFREQRSGHIVQISSHGGFKAFPGFGIYNASKFAVEGFSEAMAIELAPLGIKVTLVEPGPFRTGFAAGGFVEAEKIIDDYNPTAGAFRQRMRAVHGQQEGDPEKAARAIFDVVNTQNPPLRLPLGKIAIGSLTAKLESVSRDLNNYRQIAEATVFE